MPALTKRRPDFQLNLSIPQGMRTIQSYHASSYKIWQFSRELPIQNKNLHTPFFLLHTAVSNGGMKTFINNFKMRAKAKRIYMAMFTVGNGGEDPLGRWKRRHEFVAQF